MTSKYARRSLRQFAETVVVFQESPGDRDDTGRYVPGAYSSRHVQAVVQPLNDAVRVRVVGEGERLTGAMAFYVLPSAGIAPLRTGALPTGRDIILYREVFYRVTATEPWPDDYVLAIGERIDPQTDIPQGLQRILSGGDVVLSTGLEVSS